MSSARMAFITAGLYFILVGSVFLHNLPKWCENPTQGSNTYIAGLCK